jgi:hypothetical protein
MKSESEIKGKLAALEKIERGHFLAGIPYPEYPTGYINALKWVLGD